MLSNSEVRLILVGGAQGIGKTTYLQEVSRKTKARLIKVSDQIQATSQELYHRKYELLTFPHKAQVKEVMGFRMLSEWIRDSDVIILDGHYIDKSIDFRRPSMPSFFWNEIDEFIVIEASPEEIRRRRLQDPRPRSPNLAEIYIEVEGEQRVARELAEQFGRPFASIDLERNRTELFYDLTLDRRVTYPIVRTIE